MSDAKRYGCFSWEGSGLEGDMSDHDYSWVCNECGSDEYTSGVSEKDIENLACGGCGSNEFHKVFSPAPLQKDYTALAKENRKLREALTGAQTIIWRRWLKDGADTETWTTEERTALELLFAASSFQPKLGDCQ